MSIKNLIFELLLIVTAIIISIAVAVSTDDLEILAVAVLSVIFLSITFACAVTESGTATKN